MGGRRNAHLAAVAVMMFGLLWPAALGVADEPTSVHPGYPELSAREIANRWVFYMRGGHTPAACRLQVVQEVEGQPCASLPVLSYSCAKMTGGLPKVTARSVAQQVGTVQVSETHAEALVRAAPIRSHYTVTLTLQYSGAWQIDSVQRRTRVVTPAGAIASTRIVRNLWPGCVKLVVAHKH
jgi:hypothetical protein